MYQTMRKQFYWPGLALSCYQATSGGLRHGLARSVMAYRQ
eukprot:IDg17731t1